MKIVAMRPHEALSDEATEFQIKDRLSFQRFLGLGLDGTNSLYYQHWHVRQSPENEAWHIASVAQPTRYTEIALFDQFPLGAHPEQVESLGSKAINCFPLACAVSSIE
jgi:hypothetical protein